MRVKFVHCNPGPPGPGGALAGGGEKGGGVGVGVGEGLGSGAGPGLINPKSPQLEKLTVKRIIITRTNAMIEFRSLATRGPPKGGSVEMRSN